jgi:hypothetical protein
MELVILVLAHAHALDIIVVVLVQCVQPTILEALAQHFVILLQHAMDKVPVTAMANVRAANITMALLAVLIVLQQRLAMRTGRVIILVLVPVLAIGMAALAQHVHQTIMMDPAQPFVMLVSHAMDMALVMAMANVHAVQITMDLTVLPTAMHPPHAMDMVPVAALDNANAALTISLVIVLSIV